MPPAEFSVRASPEHVLLFACLLLVVAGVAIWIGASDGLRDHLLGRVLDFVPFGPPILLAVVLIFCVAGLAWLVRIRPPRPLLWLDGRTLVVEGIWGRRRCEVSNLSSISVTRRLVSGRFNLRIPVLEIAPVHGRRIRVGLKPANESWGDVLERLVAEIESLPVVCP